MSRHTKFTFSSGGKEHRARFDYKNSPLVLEIALASWSSNKLFSRPELIRSAHLFHATIHGRGESLCSLSRFSSRRTGVNERWKRLSAETGKLFLCTLGLLSAAGPSSKEITWNWALENLK